MTKNGQEYREQVRADYADIYPKGIEALKKAIDVKIPKWGHCPKCQKSVAVEIPDTPGLVKAMQFLADQGHGRAPEKIDVTVRTDLDRWAGYMQDMSAEKRLIMAGFLRRRFGADEDDEQRELPPAA